MERQRDAHRDGAFEELQRQTQRCTRSRKKQKLCRTCACLSEKNRTRCATSGAGSDASNEHFFVAYFFCDDALPKSPTENFFKKKKKNARSLALVTRVVQLVYHVTPVPPSHPRAQGHHRNCHVTDNPHARLAPKAKFHLFGFLPVFCLFSTIPRPFAKPRHRLASPCTLFCLGASCEQRFFGRQACRPFHRDQCGWSQTKNRF